jgi:serine protease Do
VKATLTSRGPLALLLPLVAGVVFQSVAHAGLPPLPGAAPPQASAGPAGPVSPDAAAPSLERLTRGVVTLERDGRTLGVGTVLSGDGRVLTALSALGGSDAADIHYADGTAVHAKVGHRDKVWDLALLVPLSGRWTEGLRASEADPGASELRAFIATHPGHAAVVPARLRGPMEARAREGTDPLNALDVELKGAASAGAPIMDGEGGVVGVLVRACRAADHGTCAPVVVAAPVSAIRQFLARTPVNAVTPAPWLGIVAEPDTTGSTHGVRVMAVAPQSPAEKGGLKTNPDRSQADLIVAVDGQPIDTPERLAELISKHAVGENVKLLVLSRDKFHEMTVTLRAAP